MLLTIDFGTTNTVVAQYVESSASAEIIRLPGLSVEAKPSIIPSLVYVHDGKTGEITVGDEVRRQELDRHRGNRLFRNFKRGIVGSPGFREIDGVRWGDPEAGRIFLNALLAGLPFEIDEIEQLVLTAPVASFENYVEWLHAVLSEELHSKIRVVDESTAAALGYAVTDPGAPVLVIDFGGGTLDISLVQLPESREKTGGFLRSLHRDAAERAAHVIAKAGRVIGGSDVDQWLLAEVLKRVDLTLEALDEDYPALLTRCEAAKIALSAQTSAEIDFLAGVQAYSVTVTRVELETLLEANGFFTTLRHVLDKVMHVAHREGVFKEDVTHVLLVGGTSLMPAVERVLRQYFKNVKIGADKPFTAVAEGALQVAAGMGLEDYLVNSYGLRHLDPETGAHQYEEIIPVGSRYPSNTPVEVIMGAAHEDQDSIEFVIGLIDSGEVSTVEVRHENGQAVFVAHTDQHSARVMPLNEFAPPVIAPLNPKGNPGEDRIKVAFSVDEARRLRVTVTDLKTKQVLLHEQVVVTLR